MSYVDSLARTLRASAAASAVRPSRRPTSRPTAARLARDEGSPPSGFEPTPAALIDDRYRVHGRLAQGGMGIIYRAEDVLLQRPAALKVIDPSLAQANGSIDLFRREARALARLRHENVVQIYALGMSGRSPYFAMELVEGTNLDDVLAGHQRAGTSMPLAEIVATIRKVASGLTAAHARAVTHRDVKPANILIEHETGRPVLVDFGIARQAKDTHIEALSGTPMYMAPEQIRNEAGHDGARADLYSLACTAFEMLTGRPLFSGDHPYELMHAHIEEPPPALSAVCPEYAPLDAVLARALAKEPRYRQGSCLVFAEELARAAAMLPATAEEPVTASGPCVVVFAEEGGVRRSLVREATRSLRKVGFDAPRIECVNDAVHLFQRVEAHRPRVVILDDDATNGAALAIARRLRANEGGDRMHILVLTRDMLAERTTWQAIDATRLSKPLSARALAATLDDLVLTRP